jgi:type II secretion system protein H
MRPPVPSRSRIPGFTLVELIVVLALIAILTAVILPEMRGSLEESVLRSTARSVVAACNAANSRAVASGLPHQLVIDPSTHRYRIEPTPNKARSSPSNDPAPTPESAAFDPRIVVDLHHLEPPTANSSQPTIEFHPDGTVDAAEFRLRDRSGFAISIRLNPITARPVIRELGRP